MKAALALTTISAVILLLSSAPALGLNPALDIHQYAHTAWTTRDGFSLGNIYAIAQTPDGYLWFGGEFGLARFDGVRSLPWQPPGGLPLAVRGVNSLLVTRDGGLWIGTMAGLDSWKGARLTQYPELASQFVSSLFEDHEGTVWAATLGSPGGKLCAIRDGKVNCDTHNYAFGRAIWALSEDSAGNLWAAAQSGLWRLRPDSPKPYPTAMELIGLSSADEGRMLIAVHGAGLMQFSGDKLHSVPVQASDGTRLMPDHDIDANRILRDHDGGLWIGTIERGLIHIHNGRTDTFRKADGLAGDVILAMFEDREGDIWVSSTGGLDRFRELPVSTFSVKQGLSSDATQSILAAKDGSIWIGAHDGLTRLADGKATVFGAGNGLANDGPGALFQDFRERIWVTTPQSLSYLDHGRFTAVPGVPGEEVHSITADHSGNLWLSSEQSFLHLLNGHVVERIAWSDLGRPPSASALLYDGQRGGLWMGFWNGGGVSFFVDGHLRTQYTADNGMAQGEVSDLQLGRDGALWVTTERGGLSRFKDGQFNTLGTSNGLSCNTIHWSIEDDDRALWLYTACGLVRIARSELEGWIADPKRRIETTVWDAADGVKMRSTAASAYGPRVAKARDGRIWFVTGEGAQVVDPRHLAANTIAPPVHIESIVADHKIYWQNLPDSPAPNLRLPPRIRDLQIDYVALSLAAPEKIHFKYKLEGQDPDWREVVNDRDVQYSNLGPGTYRFRVIGSNNSGIWNEQGDTLEFSIAPAYFQTWWFLALCTILALIFAWAVYHWRIRQLQRQFALTLDARVRERTSIARDLHDTLLQSFHGLLLRFEIVSQLLPERPAEAKDQLDRTIDRAEKAITEGRDAVQGLRESAVQTNDLARAIHTLGEELAADPVNGGSPAFSVTVEGQTRNLHPILRDEIYRIAGEALRNAFRHAQARNVEVEIHYDDDQFLLHVRDDGKGMDPALLLDRGATGHYGLPGMRERATLIGGKLTIWSEPGSGTEVELHLPSNAVYTSVHKRSWLSQKFLGKA